jgi:predicted MFS family arabinose efflux permease
MTDPRSEARLLLALAAIQFVYVADFMVMSPLGPVLMRTFGIGPGEFGLLVSVYTFSAAAAGFLGALFVDRFDRRRVLLVLFGIYVAALLGAAFAPGYPMLLAARALGGAAGGLMGATVYTVIADQIPEERRGAATGMVMSAFSLATIAGVPIGLLFAGWFGWPRSLGGTRAACCRR